MQGTIVARDRTETRALKEFLLHTRGTSGKFGKRSCGTGCECNFSLRHKCSKVLASLAHIRRKNDFFRVFPLSLFLLRVFFLSISLFLLQVSFSLFLSFRRFSSRAAFRVFGRALNWAPFKTWELFNALPRYAFAVCYLAYCARVTWLELRARIEKNVAPSTVHYDYLCRRY